MSDGSAFPVSVTSPQAVCYNPGLVPVNNSNFLFTRIGNLAVGEISKTPPTRGYHVSTVPMTSDTDEPFGSELTMFGWFGLASDANCYRVVYRSSTDNGTTWSAWADITSDLSIQWYDPIHLTWVSEKLGPFSPGPSGSPANLYKIPFKIDINKTWTYIDRIAIFDTRKVPDGLCQIKTEGYVWDYNESNAAAAATNLNYDPTYGELDLRIDNTAPFVQIFDVTLNGTVRDTCDILEFGHTNIDNLGIEFEAFDLNGHLRNYSLDAMYGHNRIVSPKPAEDFYSNYQIIYHPTWKGNPKYTILLRGDIYNSTVMPPCAYQFRLRVSKRTTNGWNRIYPDVEDTYHVTIKRN
jgi:hypothetical protein